MKNKIHILFLDQSIQSGGGGRSLFYILKFLDRELFEPIAMLPDEKGVLTDRIREENVCTMISEPCLHSSNRISRTKGKTIKEENIFQRLYSVARNYCELIYLAFIKLPSILSAHKVEVLYSNNDTTRILSLIAGTLTCTPVVWHVRNVSRSRFWSLLMRHSSIRKTIFISKSQRTLFDVPSQKTAVAYNGIDIEEFQLSGIQKELRKEYHIPSEAILFGVTGRLLPKKGYASFLRAGKLAIDACPDKDIRLIVIGGGASGKQEKHLQELISLVQELNLSKRVVFTGFKSDIKSYESDLDVLVVPSIWEEPFGRTALEGMALEIPVLAYRVGGLPEVIEEGISGLLFDMNDEKALGKGMAKLVHDDNLRKSMGRKGRTIAEMKFNIIERTKDIEANISPLVTA